MGEGARCARGAGSACLRSEEITAMENIAWMAWTLPSAIFFVLLAATLAVMTWLAIAYPEAERIRILRIPTTRGDRLFVTLITAAVRHLLWIGFIGTDNGGNTMRHLERSKSPL